jgi:hypothetical protein
MLRYKLPLAGLVLACAGCIAAPPPAPPPPVAVAAPPPTDTAAAEPQHCREFQQTVMVGGQPQAGYGTTCLQPDGSWQIVSQPTASHAPAPAPAVAAAPYPAYPAYPYPYYPYPYYAYPGYVGPSVGLGFRFRVH